MDAGAAFAGLGERRELEHVMAEADDGARNVGQRLRSSEQDFGGFSRPHALDQQLRSNKGERANLARDIQNNVRALSGRVLVSIYHGCGLLPL